MKKRYLGVFIILASYADVLAQQQTVKQDIAIKNMDLPNAPAFSILDATPSLIERPKATKAFALSVLNSVAESTGFPKSYAVELTPFWMIKNRNMNALKYWGVNRTKENQNVNQPFANVKQSTISFSWVSQGDTAKKNFKQHISWGIRVPLIQVRKKTQRDSLFNAYNLGVVSLRANIDDLAKITSKYFDKLITGDSTEYKKETEAYYKNLKMPTYLTRQIESLLARKPVFAVDFAFAHNITFDNPSYSSNRLGRMGAWLTLCYANQLNKTERPNYFNVYGIGRYLLDNNTIGTDGKLRKQQLIDIGAKAEFEFEDFSFAMEYLNRTNVDNALLNSDRLTGIIRYKINESLSMTGSFGQNFGKVNNLISFVGINWGISKNETTSVNK